MTEYDYLEIITKIDNATRELVSDERILEGICTEVKNLEFDFVTLQMIDKEAKTVETVYGEGIGPKWFTIARHSIQADPPLRDIQAEIVMHDPPRIEIIAGRDRRFDRYIFEKFGHKNLARVFVPIILAPGEVSWENLHWDELKDLLPNVAQPSADDRRTVLQIRNEDWAGAKGWRSQVIGTIEAGFYDSRHGISQCLALRTAKVAARRAWDLYRASLENVFWTISQAALRMVGANAASLYFVRDDTQADPKLVHYIYEACEGYRFLRTPASGLLGQRALQEQKTLVVPDKELDQGEQYLREFDRAAYDAGLRAVAVIPIVYNEVGDELFADESGDALKLTKEGLLYVGFEVPHCFTEDEINRLKLLASRAIDAIRDATNYTKTRDRARRLANVREIVQSLVDNPTSTSILDEIAGAILNILAADIVSVYEYDEREKKLLSDRPTTAGRLIEPSLVSSPVVDELSAPVQLLTTRKNVYAEDASSHRILAAKRGTDAFEKSFVARERVRSAAAVMLKGGPSADFETAREILGLMFINYRSLHRFTAEDRQVIETAASIAAVAIRNRRMRAFEERLERIERAVEPIEGLATKIEGLGSEIIEAGIRKAFAPRSPVNYNGFLNIRLLTQSEQNVLQDGKATLQSGSLYRLVVTLTNSEDTTVKGEVIRQPVVIDGGSAAERVPMTLRVDFGFIELAPAQRALKIPVTGTKDEILDFIVPAAEEDGEISVPPITVSIYQYDLLYRFCSVPISLTRP